MSGTPTGPIVPPRRLAPAVGGVPGAGEGGTRHGPTRDTRLRIVCGIVAAIAALMFAALAVLGLKAVDRAIRDARASTHGSVGVMG